MTNSMKANKRGIIPPIVVIGAIHVKITALFATLLTVLFMKARLATANQRGDFYISDAVKVIIAVVLGALLLAAITLIFNSTVIPRITDAIRSLFGP